MQQLSRIFGRILLIGSFCTVVVYIATFVLSSYSRNMSSYLAASLDKEYLISTAQSPRLIFIGGSNLALGLNSALLSQLTGYSVINMGLHGGLGLNFALNEAKSTIQPNDIIVLSIEHFLDKADKKHLVQLLDVNPKADSLLDLSFIDRAQLFVFNFQRSISSSFYKAIGRQKDPNYYREGFTDQGDLISHFGKPKPVHVTGAVVFTRTDYSANIKKINSFIESARKKGATVFFMFPAYQQSAYNINRKVLQDLYCQYKISLKCPILGTIESSVLNDKYFFDTVYHLDSMGVQKRTMIVFNLLKQNRFKVNEVPPIVGPLKD